MVRWSEREVQTIGEPDIIENYDLLKEYMLEVGSSTPLPSLQDHKACFLTKLVSFYRYHVMVTSTLWNLGSQPSSW